MATITDIVASVHPSSDAIGIILRDTIWVLFDREIDETSIDEGNFFIEGPDTDSVIGPDMGLHLPNISDSTSDDQFVSPGYAGIVQGTLSFKRINLLNTNEYTGPDDTTGDGTLWRTKAIFTPTISLQALTNYRIYLAGDENTGDTNPTGVRSRTVFDTVANEDNTGNGVATFTGSFTGSVADTYNISISIDGASGTAWFYWSKDTDSETSHGPIQTSAYTAHLLDNGVYVEFGSGNFATDDTFSVVVKPATLFTDNTYWSFTTGTGSIQTLPESTSTSIIGDPAPLIAEAFGVTNIVPADRASNKPLTTKKITVTFNSNIDPATITSESVLLTGLPVNGDETALTPREIYKSITVNGNKLIIEF